MGLFVIILSESSEKMIKQDEVYYLRNTSYNIQEISVLLSQCFYKLKRNNFKIKVNIKDMKVNTFKESV